MVGTADSRFDALAGALAAGREVEPAQLRPLIAAHTWPSCAIGAGGGTQDA